MKDEEMAEEWIKYHSGLIGSYEYVKYDYDSMQQAFLAGLKAGRPEWHKMDYKDIQSCKNIPRHIELITKYDCGLFVAHCVNKWTGDHWCEHKYGVIAWCEIPTFDKE